MEKTQVIQDPKKLPYVLRISPYKVKSTPYESYRTFTNFTLSKRDFNSNEKWRRESGVRVIVGGTQKSQNGFGWNKDVVKEYSNYREFLKDQGIPLDQVDIHRESTYYDSGNIH
jgi:hypothetical protein